jgi:hypothetical protein
MIVLPQGIQMYIFHGIIIHKVRSVENILKAFTEKWVILQLTNIIYYYSVLLHSMTKFTEVVAIIVICMSYTMLTLNLLNIWCRYYMLRFLPFLQLSLPICYAPLNISVTAGAEYRRVGSFELCRCQTINNRISRTVHIHQDSDPTNEIKICLQAKVY